MIRQKQRLLRLLPCLLLLLAFFWSVFAQAAATGGTYVIPIRGEINKSQYLFVQRSYQQALAAGAEALIFEIDTYGGYVDYAVSIKDVIFSSSLPTVCFVDSKAVSAGSLLALAGEKLVMAPGSIMGAAEPRLGMERADEKTLSFWAGQLSAVAEARGRNPRIAAAMADIDLEIEGLSEKGRLLTLTAKEALEHEMIDAIISSRSALISELDLPPQGAPDPQRSWQELFANWLSSPLIAAILLMLGIAGLAIEIFSPGFGVFGVVGIAAFALFFLGNFWAGHTGLEAGIFFAVGLILILLEIFVIPGFGFAGVLGIASLLASIIFASPSFSYALTSFLLALAGAILLIILTLRFKKTRRIWDKLTLGETLDTKHGYVSSSQDYFHLVGARGVTVTPLRPVGAAEIEGRRVEVVTDGEFIAGNLPVEVFKVEGFRVVVREIR
ncbi:MAG: nodulation protein NfeD [Clostridiales bacterium]|nr:nodulation protein NfeD [Clostridiales bacterium]